MEQSMIDMKNELIEWIENSFDSATLQKVLDLKRGAYTSSFTSDTNSENVIDDHFDQQFAAGMTSTELVENIAEHLGNIPKTD